MATEVPPARLACVDLDTFFVSVERLLDPSLVGRPVVVGGRPGQRGVVTAASYEVRPYGVRSGMSMTEAARLAPDDTVWLPSRHGVYSPYAEQVRGVLERYAPEVQTASIDEFFCDFSGCELLYHQPGDADADATIERIVRELRLAIQHEIGLPASAGIGASKSIAKMASGAAKPAGVCMVVGGQERAFVEALPVRRFPGIGPVGGGRLEQAGVHTLGQLLDLPPGPLRMRFGRLSRRVRGQVHPRRLAPLSRDRPAFSEHDVAGVAVGSISNERTFHADVGDHERVEAQLLALSQRVSWRARRRDARARTVTLKLRTNDFETITRSHSGPATDDEHRIHGVVLELYRRNRPARPVRLVGVQLSNLVGPQRQLSLPFGAAERPTIGSAVDAVREKFGYDAVRLGAVAAGRVR
jgi:DNA polymerase-4